MIGNVTLEEVEDVFRRVGTKEPVVFPWREDGQLVGLAMGFIEEWPEFPGRTAYLDCIIVLPEAKRKLEVMNLFPDTLAQVLRERGVERIVLCIMHHDERKDRLARWATRRGYIKYGGTDTRDWYVLPLKESE